MTSQRLNITLDEDVAVRLAGLARRTRINEGTLARSLLSSAIEAADPDAPDVVALLDRIPGAWDAVARGEADADAGRSIPLSDL